MSLPIRIIVTMATLIAWMALAISMQVYAMPVVTELRLPIFIPVAVFGAITGGGVVFLIILLAPRRYCPKCDALLPRFRRPEFSKQALLGGRICLSCHSAVDRHGRAERGADTSALPKDSQA